MDLYTDKNLDSDYYSDDEMVEGDEDDETITISFKNMSEKQFLAEEDMSSEELKEKYRFYYEEAKRLGLSHYVVYLNDDDDYDEDDSLCGELDVFENEY